MHTRFQNVPILWLAASVVPCHASITCDFFFAEATPVGLVTNVEQVRKETKGQIGQVKKLSSRALFAEESPF